MNFAITQRLLLGLAVLLMLAPTLLLAAGKIGRAPLWDGDVRKEMTCRLCEGVGDAKAEDGCSECHNRGVLEYIIPGSQRPLQLVGTVTNSKGEPVEGAEIEARVSEEPNGTPLLLKTNPSGQFGIKLPPGSYLLKISHQQEVCTEEIVVERNADPLPANSAETLHKLERDFQLQALSPQA